MFNDILSPFSLLCNVTYEKMMHRMYDDVKITGKVSIMMNNNFKLLNEN